MGVDIFAKGMLLFLNLLFVGVGAGLIALGVIGEMGVKGLEEPGLAKYETVPIVFITVGVIAFLIGFMGCCGAIADSNCILAVYALFKVLLMILFLGAGILFFVKKEMFVEYFIDFQNDLFRINDLKALTMETQMGCCGPAARSLHNPICNDGSIDCTLTIAALVIYFGKYIGGAFIGIAGLELLAAVTSLCLASMIGSNDKY